MATKKTAEPTPAGPDMKDRAALILLRGAFPHCGIHFSSEKVVEMAGEDTEAGEYLAGLASLAEQIHRATAHS